jgi:hypothetical protein
MLAGQRLQLTALARSAEGDSATERITWRSSAPAVVRVDERGLATALAPGRATLSAGAGNATGTLEVNVVNVTGGSVTMTPSSATARQGDVLRFAVQVRDAPVAPSTGGAQLHDGPGAARSPATDRS